MGPGGKLVELDASGVALAARARLEAESLTGRLLPWWLDHVQDDRHGGYLLEPAAGRWRMRRPGEKRLVAQARLVWTFSRAHRWGCSTERRDYFGAAEHGYRFLRDCFLDEVHGGFFWSTDRRGAPLNTSKLLLGQAFAIFALVEHARAGGEPESVEHARCLHRILLDRLHDDADGGWHEHATQDWRLGAGDAAEAAERVDRRTAGAHLHLLEALSDLLAVTGDAEVGSSLSETLGIGRDVFFPASGDATAERARDWSPVGEPQISFGHTLEFAHVMARAQRVLGESPDWRHFDALLDRALDAGLDPEHGGIRARAAADGPGDDTKVWWVQAEAVAALSAALAHEDRPDRRLALLGCLDFVDRHLVDPATGVWITSTAADGSAGTTVRSHHWKDPFHEVRALGLLVEAFAPDAFAGAALARRAAS